MGNKRRIAYKLISMAISYPQNEVAEALETGWLFENLKKVFKENKEFLNNISKLENEYSNIEDLQIIYTTNFDLKIPLYESYYVLKNSQPEEKAKFLFELEKYYLNSGVELADNDLPDYLPTELEFMHYLCCENRITQQKNFLKNHILNWIYLLANRAEEENIKFYKNLIDFIKYFLKSDYQYLSKFN